TDIEYEIKDNQLCFNTENEKKIKKIMHKILSYAEYKNIFTNKKIYYINEQSQIPLIGSIAYGLIDRGSNIIEIRPNTGCNMNCPFCSVDEGLSSKKKVEYYVEPHYLAKEFQKLCELKNTDYIEAHIGPQGEPVAYDDLELFISLIKKIPNVKIISINTNGTLITKELADKLIKAGLNRVNLSLHTMDTLNSKKMFGSGKYDIEQIKEISQYLANKIELVIAPVLVKGYNEEDLIEVINFAKKISKNIKFPKICIQNFLRYKFGRNPVKEIKWDEFYKQLDYYEKSTNTNMKITESDFNIKPCNSPEKTIKKNEILKVKIVLPGRLQGEKIAMAKKRSISIFNAENLQIGKEYKIKIIKDKHNLYTAVPN
ncbi:radical SAM protein, partial [Candidatus Woesearchaeota archaeon]|nr:radical SAM protein [Candidatus Woesearchaeota archaeon]